MKILVVEDDADTLTYVARGLGQLGHTVDKVESGGEGLHMATNSPYDVIVLDRMLPELDGVTILKSIRVAGVKTPVLFLTALDGVNERVAALTPAPTTTWSSRSRSPNWRRACMRSAAARCWPRSNRC